MYSFEVKKLKCTDTSAILVPYFEDETKIPNEEVQSKIDILNKKGQFKGAYGEIFSTNRMVGDDIQDLILLGLGKSEDLTKEKLRKAFGKVVAEIKRLKSDSIFIRFDAGKLSLEDSIQAIVEGMALASYTFDKYKSDKKEEANVCVHIGGHNIKEEEIELAKKAVEEATLLAETTCLARDLVNEPSNIMYPKTLAEKVEEASKEYGFEVEVFDEKRIEELKMEAFLSVGMGSDNLPRLIVMRYFGDKDNMDQRLALVGKGLTYDSGGYSIKPTNGMVTMKSDMGGAAAVIGAISAIAKRNLKINVIAIVAACENMISGHAYKPGDIIGSMAGKTIEILNTDAEGRLTLIDAVTYAIEKEKASEVIDVATLTGAALVALGDDVTAVVTNNDEFYNELQEATKVTGEKVWQLPSFEEYNELIKSSIADLKNIGGKYAGTITAGLFIGEFVQNKPWLHLDIAGPAFAEKKGAYCPVGGTGAGVRTLYELANRRCK
ncbi:leucyl aminopeptidase [Clostridium sp. B9]|uniref:leucyl aminopeptidase n=1 Tax=Clostridium sp. B9 TaxID=3423224 RepID=UPI003D2F2333